MSHPCSYCGVRTDVACRHREATALPRRGGVYECGTDDGKRSSTGHQFWASAIKKLGRDRVEAALKACI